MSERVIVVDINNTIAGSADKLDVYRKGLWHRVAVVWVVNSQGEVLIQRRSQETDLMPGKWDHSCAGHVYPGERTIDAARRELAEELGLESSLELLVTYKFEEAVAEKQLKRFWYIYQTAADGPFRIDTSEVSEVRFAGISQLQQELAANPETFTSSLVHTLKALITHRVQS